MDPAKRELRERKRYLKQKGGKRRRAFLKRSLDRNPQEADLVNDRDFDFGRARSADYNGLDRPGGWCQ